MPSQQQHQSHESITPSSSHPHPPRPIPSRRVRVYQLENSGNWRDWGIGWLWMGDEVPVQQQTTSNDKRHHILIKQELKTHSNDSSSSSQAPVGTLGLPSLTLPTLLTLHLPNGSSFTQQGSTIICFTTPLEQQHTRHQQQQQQQEQQEQNVQSNETNVKSEANDSSATTSAAASSAAAASAVVDGTNTIDIALSFQTEVDAKYGYTSHTTHERERDVDGVEVDNTQHDPIAHSFHRVRTLACHFSISLFLSLFFLAISLPPYRFQFDSESILRPITNSDSTLQQPHPPKHSHTRGAKGIRKPFYRFRKR